MNISLIDFYKKFADEIYCIKYLETMRWGEKIVCPHCSCDKIYRFSNGRLLKCAGCKKQFTVRIGTIFEDSHLPLQKWFLAVYMLTSLKKGISSVQIGKALGITQKSAWFVLHRIRYAVNNKTILKPLSGIVEADETYQGGQASGSRGRGSNNKTKIFGLKERQGDVRMQVVENVKRKTLLPIIKKNVEEGSVMATDEFLTYTSLDKEGYEHKTVNHGAGEFVKGVAHTNGLENTWSHFKRGVTAIQIHISKKHTNKYLDEYAFRLNTKSMTDSERFESWFNYCGRRLTYKKLIGLTNY